MTMLVEISLMPGESVLKTGEIARELSFVQQGALTVTDTKGTLIELITGEGTAPCVVGAASFLMGLHPLAVATVMRIRISTCHTESSHRKGHGL